MAWELSKEVLNMHRDITGQSEARKEDKNQQKVMKTKKEILNKLNNHKGSLNSFIILLFTIFLSVHRSPHCHNVFVLHSTVLLASYLAVSAGPASNSSQQLLLYP